MCTGRLDLSYILRAFSRGADGVFIVGCHLNECNYITHGNFHALSMVYLGKRLLSHAGINPERFRIEFMSGGEGTLFAEVMNDFGKKIRELGPLGSSEGVSKEVIRAKLEAATSLAPYMRLVERERLRIPEKSKEAYQQFFTGPEFEDIFRTLILDKLAISEITMLLRDGPLTTGKMAEKLGLTPSEVSRHINMSSRQGLVRYDEAVKCYALA